MIGFRSFLRFLFPLVVVVVVAEIEEAVAEVDDATLAAALATCLTLLKAAFLTPPESPFMVVCGIAHEERICALSTGGHDARVVGVGIADDTRG